MHFPISQTNLWILIVGFVLVVLCSVASSPSARRFWARHHHVAHRNT